MFSSKLILDVCACACQVLVVFTDGLNEDVMKLEHQSELLRLSGEAKIHMALCITAEYCSCQTLQYYLSHVHL